MSREIKSITVHLPDGEVRNEVRVYEYPVKGDFLDLQFGQGIGRYVKRYRVQQRTIGEVTVTPHSINGGVVHIHVAELVDDSGLL